MPSKAHLAGPGGRPRHSGSCAVITRLNVGGPATHVSLVDRGLATLGWETLLVHGVVESNEAEVDVDALDIPTRRLPTLHRADRSGRGRPKPGRGGASHPSLSAARHPHAPVESGSDRARGRARDLACRPDPHVPWERLRRLLQPSDLPGDPDAGTRSRSLHPPHRRVERPPAGGAPRARDRAGPSGSGSCRSAWTSAASRVPIVPRRVRDSASRPDALVVLAMGRLVPIKRLERLIDAVALVAPQFPSLRLAMVGDGEERATLEALADARGIRDVVGFAGWSSDTPSWYAAADMVTLTSDREGTPLALIEAAASGRPVVAGDVGGVADIVIDGETGFVVAHDDVPAFADRLSRLASDPGLRAQAGIGRSGAGDVVQRRSAGGRSRRALPGGAGGPSRCRPTGARMNGLPFVVAPAHGARARAGLDPSGAARRPGRPTSRGPLGCPGDPDVRWPRRHGRHPGRPRGGHHRRRGRAGRRPRRGRRHRRPLRHRLGRRPRRGESRACDSRSRRRWAP